MSRTSCGVALLDGDANGESLPDNRHFEQINQPENGLRSTNNRSLNDGSYELIPINNETLPMASDLVQTNPDIRSNIIVTTDDGKCYSRPKTSKFFKIYFLW